MAAIKLSISLIGRQLPLLGRSSNYAIIFWRPVRSMVIKTYLKYRNYNKNHGFSDQFYNQTSDGVVYGWYLVLGTSLF